MLLTAPVSYQMHYKIDVSIYVLTLITLWGWYSVSTEYEGGSKFLSISTTPSYEITDHRVLDAQTTEGLIPWDMHERAQYWEQWAKKDVNRRTGTIAPSPRDEINIWAGSMQTGRERVQLVSITQRNLSDGFMTRRYKYKLWNKISLITLALLTKQTCLSFWKTGKSSRFIYYRLRIVNSTAPPPPHLVP